MAEKEGLGIVSCKKAIVTHDVTIGGNLTVSGSLNAAGNAVTQGTITTLAVSGNGTVAGTFGVTGAATVGGTLGVTGVLTTTTNAVIGGTCTATSTLIASAGCTVGTTLAVAGAATFATTVAVTGNATVGGTLGVTGTLSTVAAATVGGNLTVTGTSVFAGIVTAPNLPRAVKTALAAVDTGGGAFSWQNPEGAAIVVKRVVIRVGTAAAGACTLAVGTTAVSGTTSSNNLLDALDVHSATGLFDNMTNGGSAGKTMQTLASGGWVTGSKASGATSGLVGTAYIEYVLQ